MKLVYLAGPYRSDKEYGIKQNIQRAEDVQVELLKMGYFVFNPHKNTAFLGGVVSDEIFLKGDLEIIDRFHSGKDIIVMLDGWVDSKGARDELSHAINRGIKAYHWPKDREELRRNAK